MVNIFKFLEKTKGKKIPFLFKLINNLLTEDDLIYNGDLNLIHCPISSLPNNLTVNGNIYISETYISDLPDDLYVGGDLFCRYTPLAYNIKNDKSLLTKYQKQVKGVIIYVY